MFKKTALILLIGLLLFGFFYFGRSLWYPVWSKINGRKTVTGVLDQIGPRSRNKLKKIFQNRKSNYPPESITLIAYKHEGILELWDKQNGPRYITSFKFTAKSGGLGPKLREGDRQIPEGVYQIIGLNPNSSYHLSLKLNYPNDFDLKQAAQDGRNEPGTNIFIHGKAVSIGCIALGDKVIETLFVLTADIGKDNVEVIVAPNRTVTKSTGLNYPAWTNKLYEQIKSALGPYQPLD